MEFSQPLAVINHDQRPLVQLTPAAKAAALERGSDIVREASPAKAVANRDATWKAADLTCTFEPGNDVAGIKPLVYRTIGSHDYLLNVG